MIEEEKAVMVGKGTEYCESQPDRLFNFKNIAAEIGLDPIQVWFIYFRKHISSIISYVKLGGKVTSNEPIEGRIMDCRNYLALLRGLIEDSKPKADVI